MRIAIKAVTAAFNQAGVVSHYDIDAEVILGGRPIMTSWSALLQDGALGFNGWESIDQWSDAGILAREGSAVARAIGEQVARLATARLHTPEYAASSAPDGAASRGVTDDEVTLAMVRAMFPPSRTLGFLRESIASAPDPRAATLAMAAIDAITATIGDDRAHTVAALISAVATLCASTVNGHRLLEIAVESLEEAMPGLVSGMSPAPKPVGSA